MDDLSRMPQIVRAARPWLRVDPQRVYAVGGSMGGQETLLLVGRHPRLLAGAVAFDSVTDFFRRYSDFAALGRKGRMLQTLARIEVGGTPGSNPQAYRLRSPYHWLGEIARYGLRVDATKRPAGYSQDADTGQFTPTGLSRQGIEERHD